jgi:uncharacterized membrane protein
LDDKVSNEYAVVSAAMNKISGTTLRTYSVDLVLVIVATLVTLAFNFLPYLNQTFIRPIFGVVVVFFVPGYALVAALFPNDKGINNSQRIALSLGLSVAVVPAMLLILSYWFGMNLGPLLVSLALFIVICTVIAEVRRRALPQAERFSVKLQQIQIVEKAFSGSESRVDKLLSLILVLSIIALSSTIGYTIAFPPPGEPFTEFYILGANGTIGNYATQYQLGELKPVTVGIVNHEQRDTPYELVVRLNDTNKSTVLYTENISIADNQTWQKVLNLKPDRTGSNMKIEFLLYRNNQLGAPYRETYLPVTVS